MSIIRLLKPRPEAATPAPAASPAAPEPSLSARFEPLIRQLEDDVRLTMRVVGVKADRSKEQISETIGHVDEIGRASDELAEFAAAAKDATAAMTETMQRLDAATRAIERNAASADLFADEAAQLARELGDSTQRMNQAVEKITGVVQLITTIARRTNLLALNASIEAARAGPAGRGFSIIANEMKSLAQQVHAATGDVTSQTANLQTAARSSTDSTKRIGALLMRIDPVFGAIRGALEAQASQSRGVAAHAAQSASFVGYVVGKAAAVKAAASRGARSCRAAGEAQDETRLSLDRLTQRAVVFLRQSVEGDRRTRERVPVRIAGVFVSEGAATPVVALDLCAGGALLTGGEEVIRRGVTGKLRLADIGTIEARVTERSALGLHVRFGELDADAHARLERALDAARARYAPWVARVQAAAAEIARVFDHGVATGQTSLDELITCDYRPVENAEPVAFATLASGFYARALPEILDEQRRSAEAPLFVLAIDRNGFLPATHRSGASLDRVPTDAVRGLRAASAGNAPVAAGGVDFVGRDGSLFDRWTVLAGARSTAAFHLRADRIREADPQSAAILIVSCPIFVRGRLWGAAQGGFAY